MLEEILGSASWPIVALLIAIASLCTYVHHDDNQLRREVRVVAVAQCAHVEDAGQCAARVQEIIKATK